jgi:hypothetical protein
MRTGACEPEMLVHGFLVRGAHHILFGKKESGKTWLILAAIVAPLLLAGECVVYIDKEMSRAAIAERLLVLGVSPEQVEAGLVYLELPHLTGDDATRKQWAAMLNELRPAVVLADASAGVLADADLNENQTSDVLKWDAWYFEPARRSGATTLMLDHTGHKDQERSRGASGKGAAAKVELHVERTHPFARDLIGAVNVTLAKNSLAAPIPEVQRYRLGGSPEGFVFARDDEYVANVVSATGDEFLARVEQVITNAGPGGIEGTNALVEAVGANRGKVLRAAKDLIEDFASPITTRKNGRALVYHADVTGAARSKS